MNYLPERITFRFGKLIDRVCDRLKETGESPTKYLRRLIVSDLESMAAVHRTNPKLSPICSPKEIADHYPELQDVVNECTPGNYLASDEHWGVLVERAALLGYMKGCRDSVELLQQKTQQRFDEGVRNAATNAVS